MLTPFPPPPAFYFLSIEGISSTYQLNVLNKNQILVRNRPCWCLPCYQFSTTHNKSDFKDNFPVPRCKSCEASPENYNFFIKNCHKLTGRNVTGKVKEIVPGSQDQAATLTQGDWVLCYSGSMGDDEEKVWLGRCINNDVDKVFRKGVTWRNDTGKAKANVGAAKITLAKTEMGVTVQWYDRCREQLSPDTCVQYKICEEFPPCVQSATSVISTSANFTVVQMGGIQATTAYTRRQADSTPGTQFIKKFKQNMYMTTNAQALQRQMRETWELDLGTYMHAVNAVDWFNSR